VILAETQQEFGLVDAAQVKDIKAHVETLDIPRSFQLEEQLKHDLMAELMTFAEQCPIGGGIIHLGATSVDIKDNTIALQCRESLSLILKKVEELLIQFAEKISKYADLPVIAFTHLQPAEPTTLGYRLSQYAQDLFLDWNAIKGFLLDLKGKGFKGAVGTSASFAELVGLENLPRFESTIGDKLGLSFFNVTTQTYPRKMELDILNLLAGLSAGINKFAFDLRILQSPPIGELAEPFGFDQVGSSAMPFKRNPIRSESINSLARVLAQFPRIAWDNAAHSLLERTLDDSANRRSILPEAFMIADELLSLTTGIIKDLVVDVQTISRNLQIYGPFAATERLLMALCKEGANRQDMHIYLRKHSLTAWDVIRSGGKNPLCSLVCSDEAFTKYLPGKEIKNLMDASSYVGDAPKRARDLSLAIKNKLGSGFSS
jgi:adenylosuccinate lyase